MEIVFRGKKAIIFIVGVLVVWLIISFTSYRRALSSIDRANELILSRIRVEVSELSLELAKEMKNQKMGRRQSEEVYKRIAEFNDIKYKILETRGGFFGGFYAKVELTLGGKTPPDGERIRYYNVDHSVITGFHLTTPLDVFRIKFLYDIAIWR